MASRYFEWCSMWPDRWATPLVSCLFYSISLTATVTGYGVEKIGFRPFILSVLFYQCAVTTIFFVAPSIKMLLLAECLAGIAFGVFMSSLYPMPMLYSR